jgi:hypothetical protein
MEKEPKEDLGSFALTEDETAQVIKEAFGGTVTWLRRDGHPTGAWVQTVVVDGQVYTTSTKDRGKNKAWRRDPRTAWVFDAHWPLQQLRNLALQIVVGGKADRILRFPLFQRLVDLRLGEGRVGTKDHLLAPPLLPLDLGQ